MIALSDAGSRFHIMLPRGLKIAVQRGVRSVENQVAIAAITKVPLDLGLDGRRQFSL